MAMARTPLAIAFNGLCTATGATALLSFLRQSAGANDAYGVQAAQLDVVLQAVLPVAAAAAFFTALTFIFVHLHNNGGGGGRRIQEVMFFVLCASTGLPDLFLFLQPGATELEVAQAQFLGVAAVLLPPVAAATFFLSMTLIYVHACTGSGGAQNPAAVELVSKTTIGATLVTAMLSLIMVGLTISTE